MATCTPSTLLESAKAFLALDGHQLEVVIAELVKDWAGNTETPQELLARAKCLSCLNRRQVDLVQAQLLCEIYDAIPEPTPCGFAYEPESAVISWTDATGNHDGNLDTFCSTAQKASVTVLTLYDLEITSISGLDSLPGLQQLNCAGNDGLTTLDLTGCAALQILNVFNSGLTALDLRPATGIVTVDCQNNVIAALDCLGCVILDSLTCNDNSMDETHVDQVLCDLNTNAAVGGTVDISNNVAPGAAGLICKTALEGFGWTVSTD